MEDGMIGLIPHTIRIYIYVVSCRGMRSIDGPSTPSFVLLNFVSIVKDACEYQSIKAATPSAHLCGISIAKRCCAWEMKMKIQTLGVTVPKLQANSPSVNIQRPPSYDHIRIAFTSQIRTKMQQN